MSNTVNRQRDPRNVRDALLEAGCPVDEVEAMLAAAEAYRELERLKSAALCWTLWTTTESTGLPKTQSFAF